MNHLKTGSAYFAKGSYKSYKYNGKELQETGLYSYGWREYMPDIARWNGIDQLAEDYLSTSTYAYVANNPLSNFDVDGRWFDQDGHIDTSGYTPGISGHVSYMSQFLGINTNDGSGSGGANVSFGQTQMYKDIMAYLDEPEPEYFKGINFTQFGIDEEPVNFFGKDDKPVFHKKFKEMHDHFKNTKGDGIFRVYGHGNLNMLWNEDERLFTAKDFDKAMSAKNKNWSNIDKYKSPILILFACLSASDVGKNGSMAKQISKVHPNLTVIGFRGFVEYDLDVEGIKNVNRQQGAGDGNGLIVFYKNGRALSGYYYRELLKKYTHFK